MTEGQGVWCVLEKLVLFNFFQNNGLVFKGTDSYGTLLILIRTPQCLQGFEY